MKIGISSNGTNLSHVVAESFEKSKYLLIVETDDSSIEVFENKDLDSDRIELAQKLIDHDCEAIITGSIEQPAFDVIAVAQITRYNGVGYNIKESLRLMDEYKLNFIKDFEGSDDSDNHVHSCAH